MDHGEMVADYIAMCAFFDDLDPESFFAGYVAYEEWFAERQSEETTMPLAS